jgi:DNA-binding transcriptional regulator/RsmH inhibitor MraZ
MMLLIPHKEAINNGFCWGSFESTIDEETRIRLNKGIRVVLTENDAQKLWRFPDPTHKGIVLCPDENRLKYIAVAMNSHKEDLDKEIAYRKFISSGEPTNFDKQGRIALTSACIEHSQFKSGDSVIILGTGLWYELWHLDEWLRQIQQCK